MVMKQLSAKFQQKIDKFLNEVTMITSMQHQNLVHLWRCCLKGELGLLVYDYLENQSLHHAIFGG